MLKMRLQRVGRKHEPSFRLVLTDSKNSPKSGRFNEILGSYDPRKTTDLIKTDRVKYWLDKGVQVSDTVHNLLITHGVLSGKKKNVLPKKTAPVKETPVAEAPIEAPVAEAAPAEETPVETAEAPVETAEAPVEEKTEETPAA